MDHLSIREVQLPWDGSALQQLDTSFTTGVICQVNAYAESFTMQFTPVAPITKTYSLDDLDAEDRLWESGWVACIDERPVGFAATRYESWNRRLNLWHLYVDSAVRRKGVARSLLQAAVDHGRQDGALTVWLEVTNINAPAIRAYQALGFELCGLDLTLYSNTAARGEVALFMARAIG